jgi:S-adenosylmethionine:tRNA ribosyltransferase-isomerase
MHSDQFVKTSDFDYDLPESQIAYHPPAERDGGRLLVLNPNSKENEHHTVKDLPKVLPGNAVLVLNDTKVFKARLQAMRTTGGQVEVLLIRPHDTDELSCRFEVLTKSNRPLKVGDALDISGVPATVKSKGEQGEAILNIALPLHELFQHTAAVGEVPLPPYIKRRPVPEDVERYQTVYAAYNGSSAAPTAGLHFTDALLKEIQRMGVETVSVTLHVGPGTFRPVKAERLSDHRMDKEEYILTEEAVSKINRAKTEGRPIIAVGTTATRALEGAFAAKGLLEAGSGFTELFITPGFQFQVVDGLITNFHLPKSTLLSLVSALAGRDRILSAYAEAVAKQYRFYSYGDAMFILPRNR